MSVKLVAALAISAAVLAVPVTSQAAGADCSQIEAQLVSTNSVPQAAQQSDLLRLREAAREASCDQALFGERVAICARLNAQIANVQTSLEAVAQQPAADLDALAAINGCRSADQVINGSNSADNKRLVTEIFGDDSGDDGRVKHVLNASADMPKQPKSSIEMMPEQSAAASPSFVHPEGEKQAAVEQVQQESALRPIDPNRRVRVVGPTFLPDPADSMIEKGPFNSTN